MYKVREQGRSGAMKQKVGFRNDPLSHKGTDPDMIMPWAPDWVAYSESDFADMTYGSDSDIMAVFDKENDRMLQIQGPMNSGKGGDRPRRK